MVDTNVNIVAVLVATVAAMITGALWYSPVLFAKPWLKLVGKSESDMKADAARTGYMIAAVSSLVLAYVLAVFYNMTNVLTIQDAIKMGFWLWLGLVATTSGVNAVFSGRPRNLYLIEIGHHLVVILIMSVILTLWR